MQEQKNKEKYLECKENIERKVREEIDLSREVSDKEIQEMIDQEVLKKAKEYDLSFQEKRNLGKEIFDMIRKLDILQELIDAEDVTEIMINGPQNIFIEKSGRIQRWNKKFENAEALDNIIQQIVAKCNRAVNEASPIVDARIGSGERVHIILPPVALNGPIVTIRKFPSSPITMEKLIELNSITKEVADFLEDLVIAGYNIFISGGTGSGKTTFLNALSHYIPNTQRIITIEDSAELQLQEIPNLVRLETRNANAGGGQAITIRDLLKASLRMRPDRIIVGEVRGVEAIDMLQALNTGHDGSISTGHANSSRDMLTRLETMILMGQNGEMPLAAVRRQIASGLDVIVHLGRMRDHSRKVLEVIEITGFDGEEIQTNIVYAFEECGDSEKVDGSLIKKNDLINKEKLKNAGIKY